MDKYFHMKQHTIFITIGLVTITIAAAFKGTRNSYGFSTNLYYSNGVGSTHCHIIRSAISTADFTTGGGGSQATILTSNGSARRRIFSTSNCTTPTYFHPI